MLREGVLDYLDNATLVLIPSSKLDLTGDLGYRSDVSIDNSILSYSSGGVLYTTKDYYIAHDIEDRYYLIYINAKETNPVYSSIYNVDSREFTFNNFDITGFSAGDKILIVNKATLEGAVESVIESVTGTTIKLTLSTTFVYTSGIRYKIISNNGVLISVIDNIRPISVKSKKVKFGGEINV